jgi:hypothetical protein
MESLLPLLLRLLHIIPAVVVVGGAVGGAFLNHPVAAPLSRGTVLVGIVALLGSGLYNFLTYVQAGVPKGYHMWFGIKFLLGLHVMTMLFLLTKPDAPAAKRQRWQVSALWGTIAVIIAGAYLRALRG